MKKLLICAKEKEYMESIYSQLLHFFGDCIEIISIAYGNNLNPNIAMLPKDTKADIAVITTPYALSFARKHLKENAKVIIYKFGYKKETINELRKYPNGTETLVHCKYVSDSHLTADALYEAGLKNLNLYINYQDNKNIKEKKFDLTIHDNNSVFKEYNDSVFILDEELISINTLLEIKASAGLHSNDLDQKIEKYTEEFTEKDTISYYLEQSSIINMQFRILSDYLDQGILIINEDGRILNHNKLFSNLFSLPTDMVGSNIDMYGEVAPFIMQIKNLNDFNDIYYKFNNHQYMVTKKDFGDNGISGGSSILMVKDVTEMMKMENSMYRQMALKGHVAKHSFNDIIGNSDTIKLCIEKSKKISSIDKPTLLIGESGTGKELFAQSIHNHSLRKKFPFVAVNCAAIPENLLESELFGYEEGAFTGAKKGGKTGLFQLANKGTLFLDEIGEISLSTQAKLLRALESNEIMKVGSDQITKIDVKIIAATNRDLRQSIKSSTFRLDLYYRLNTLMVKIPPLRERREDIKLFCAHYLHSNTESEKFISQEVYDFFENQNWEGNVRQLKNTVEYAAHIAENEVRMEHLPEYFTKTETLPDNLDDYELMKKLGFSNTKHAKVALEILLMLKDKSMGRRQLVESLKEKGIHVSEYMIRSVLSNLELNGYVNIGTGRGGCSLGSLGIDIIRNCYL